MTVSGPDGRTDTPRLRLLFLTPFPPSLDGAHGGSRVTAQLLDRLAAQHAVGLICLRHQDDPPVDDQLAARLEFVHEVRRPDVDGSHHLRAWSGVRGRALLLRGTPLWATSVSVPAFREQLRAVLKSWNPDIAQIHYTAMGVHLPEIERARVPVILWDPDPATNAAVELRHATDGDRLLRWLDVRAWRRFERSVLRRVDAVVAFTERDVRALEGQAPTTPIVRIPFGTDFVERTFANHAAGGQVLFVGNFVHPPNIDAAYRLVRSIFPGVLGRHPSASLQIVGDNVPRELSRASGGQVTVTGRVPDPVPYIERAAVLAAPIRFGGGMRVKVLEALAAGKALVASPLAVAGLDVADGEEFLAAGTDDEFVERICALLTDETRRNRMGARARAWAEANLGWDHSVRVYVDLYTRLLEDRASLSPTRPADAEAGIS